MSNPIPKNGTVIADYCRSNGMAISIISNGVGGVREENQCFLAVCTAPAEMLAIQEIFASAPIDEKEWTSRDNTTPIFESELCKKLTEYPLQTIKDFIKAFFNLGSDEVDGLAVTVKRQDGTHYTVQSTVPTALMVQALDTNTIDYHTRVFVAGIAIAIGDRVRRYREAHPAIPV